MSPRKSELDDYRRRNEDTGEWIYFCPDCKNESGDGPLELGSLHKFKSHMQSTHGGYTVSEPASDVALSEEGQSGNNVTASSPVNTSQASKPSTAPSKPKRLSQHSRELNEKLNEALKLCVKHLLKGLGKDKDGRDEKERLDELRSDVTMGFVGIEIDFDEKLVSVSGKWAAIISVVALNVLPSLPSIKEIMEKAKSTEEPKA